MHALLTFDPMKRSSDVCAGVYAYTYVCVCVCNRGFPLHSLQSSVAIMLSSPAFSLCAVCLCVGEKAGVLLSGTCLTATAALTTGPHRPWGYVLVTLVNLSSSFLLLPPSKNRCDGVSESQRGPSQKTS